MEYGLIIGISISLLVQLYHWYFIFWLPTPTKKVGNTAIPGKWMSVVICYHGKSDSLVKVLDWVDEQTYRNFEVIVVNDGDLSGLTDAEEEFIHSHPSVKYLYHDKKAMGKRGALSMGIENAQYEWLVFTDIDCRPEAEWLSLYERYFDPSNKMILGLSPYEVKDGWLNLVIQHETFLTAVQYLGWAHIGKPYMGVGRNMGYHSSLYDASLFHSTAVVPYGDDDLWVNKVATKFNTVTMIEKGSHVHSIPSTSWLQWLGQKIRHVSGGKFYDRATKLRIGMFSMFFVIEKILLLILVFNNIIFCLCFLLLKFFLLILPIRNNRSKVGMVSSTASYWLYEWFHFIYLLIISPYVFFISKAKW